MVWDEPRRQSENVSDSVAPNAKYHIGLQNCSGPGIPSCCNIQSSTSSSNYDYSAKSPGSEIVRPFPDLKSIEKWGKTKLKGTSRIWTKTSEKIRLEEAK